MNQLEQLLTTRLTEPYIIIIYHFVRIELKNFVLLYYGRGLNY